MLVVIFCANLVQINSSVPLQGIEEPQLVAQQLGLRGDRLNYLT